MRQWVVLVFVGLGCACPGRGRENAGRDEVRARFTEVPPEATGRDRDVLVALAGLRDRTCACATKDCIEPVERELDMETGALGPTATAALRDAASEMIDELMACTHQVHENTVFGRPLVPTEPATARAIVESMRRKPARSAGGGVDGAVHEDDAAEAE